MPDTQHVHMVINNFVHGDVRPWRKDKFSCIGGQARTATTRKSTEIGNGSINRSGHAVGGGRVVFADVLYNSGEIVGRMGCPANPDHD